MTDLIIIICACSVIAYILGFRAGKAVGESSTINWFADKARQMRLAEEE